MELIKPKFLKNTNVSEDEIKKEAVHLQNWVVLSKSIKDLTQYQLELLIIIEINYKRRAKILERLLGRYTRFIKMDLYEETAEALEKVKADVVSPILDQSTRQLEVPVYENKPA